MPVGGRRVRRWPLAQLAATCFLLSLLLFWDPLEQHVVSHVRSYSYRYLVNSYASGNASAAPRRAPGPAYLINHGDACQGRDVLLLLFVKSAPENRARRDAIRGTWGAPGARHTTLFALGRPSRGGAAERRLLQARLSAEDAEHGDLVQQDFDDTFHNLTLKLLLQLDWIQAHCAHARFVMSADDDVFVHTPNVLAYLRGLELAGARGVWVGRVHRGSPPVRDRSSKYYVPYAMYQWPAYPDYTAGAAYVVSGDVAARVHEAARTLPPSLHIDDVFMGLCADRAKVAPQHHPFFSGEGRAPYHPCIYEKMMTSHGHVHDLRALWEAATREDVRAVSSGFFGPLYCRLVKIALLCKIKYVDTYPCSAAFY